MKELGDRAAQGRAYGNLGNTHYLLGSFVEATTFHKEVSGRTAGWAAQGGLDIRPRLCLGLVPGLPGRLPLGTQACGGPRRAPGLLCDLGCGCALSAWPSRRNSETRRPSGGPTATWGTRTSSWGALTWLLSTTSERHAPASCQGGWAPRWGVRLPSRVPRGRRMSPGSPHRQTDKARHTAGLGYGPPGAGCWGDPRGGTATPRWTWEC